MERLKAAVGLAFIFWIVGLFFGGGVVGACIGFFLGLMLPQDDDKKVEEPDSHRNISSIEPLPVVELAALADDASYVEIVTIIIAGCMAADGQVDSLEMEMASSIIRNDDHVLDKQSAVDLLNEKITEFHSARKDSKAGFNLKITSALAKVALFSDVALKERLLVILEGMHEVTNASESSDFNEFVAKVRVKLEASEQPISKKDATENYILKSGDREAIEMLKQMRSDPARYKDKLCKGAQSNSVLRTALGVFTGFIAADLVTGVIHQHQLQQSLEAFSAELNSLGGADGDALRGDEITPPSPEDTIDDGSTIAGSDSDVMIDSEPAIEADSEDFDFELFS